MDHSSLSSYVNPRQGRRLTATRKVLPLAELLARLEPLRRDGARVVLTNGCFDLLHVGHVRYLQQAGALGDLLIVGLNSDSSVRLLKGPGRPLVPEEERAEVLAALECVDYVVVFSEPTAESLVAAIRPDCYVKGGDYTEEALPEAGIARRLGAEVRIIPLVPGRSTTAIIQAILQRYQQGGGH